MEDDAGDDAIEGGDERFGEQPVVELGGTHLEFERIAVVRLKGFTETTEIFIAVQRGED